MPISLHLQVRFLLLHQLRRLRNVLYEYLALLSCMFSKMKEVEENPGIRKASAELQSNSFVKS